MSKHVHVELLLGRRVRDREGKLVGRIESIHAKWTERSCLIEEYRLGPGAWLERFGISSASLIGWRLTPEPMCVPWDQFDLSDPESPRLKCRVEDLPSS